MEGGRDSLQLAVDRILSARFAWDVLGIPVHSSHELARLAYKRVVLLVHPDKLAASGLCQSSSDAAIRALNSALEHYRQQDQLHQANQAQHPKPHAGVRRPGAAADGGRGWSKWARYAEEGGNGDNRRVEQRGQYGQEGCPPPQAAVSESRAAKAAAAGSFWTRPAIHVAVGSAKRPAPDQPAVPCPDRDVALGGGLGSREAGLGHGRDASEAQRAALTRNPLSPQPVQDFKLGGGGWGGKAGGGSWSRPAAAAVALSAFPPSSSGWIGAVSTEPAGTGSRTSRTRQKGKAATEATGPSGDCEGAFISAPRSVERPRRAVPAMSHSPHQQRTCAAFDIPAAAAAADDALGSQAAVKVLLAPVIRAAATGATGEAIPGSSFYAAAAASTGGAMLGAAPAAAATWRAPRSLVAARSAAYAATAAATAAKAVKAAAAAAGHKEATANSRGSSEGDSEGGAVSDGSPTPGDKIRMTQAKSYTHGVGTYGGRRRRRAGGDDRSAEPLWEAGEGGDLADVITLDSSNSSGGSSGDGSSGGGSSGGGSGGSSGEDPWVGDRDTACSDERYDDGDDFMVLPMRGVQAAGSRVPHGSVGSRPPSCTQQAAPLGGQERLNFRTGWGRPTPMAAGVPPVRPTEAGVPPAQLTAAGAPWTLSAEARAPQDTAALAPAMPAFRQAVVSESVPKSIHLCSSREASHGADMKGVAASAALASASAWASAWAPVSAPESALSPAAPAAPAPATAPAPTPTRKRRAASVTLRDTKRSPSYEEAALDPGPAGRWQRGASWNPEYDEPATFEPAPAGLWQGVASWNPGNESAAEGPAPFGLWQRGDSWNPGNEAAAEGPEPPAGPWQRALLLRQPVASPSAPPGQRPGPGQLQPSASVDLFVKQLRDDVDQGAAAEAALRIKSCRSKHLNKRRRGSGRGSLSASFAVPGSAAAGAAAGIPPVPKGVRDGAAAAAAPHGGKHDSAAAAPAVRRKAAPSASAPVARRTAGAAAAGGRSQPGCTALLPRPPSGQQSAFKAQRSILDLLVFAKKGVV